MSYFKSKEDYSQQQLLKYQLLDGEINIQRFFKKVFSLDQSTVDRNNSAENINLLLDPDVVKLCKGNSEYFDILSLTYFHLGLTELIGKSKNIKTAKIYFKELVKSVKVFENR